MLKNMHFRSETMTGCWTGWLFRLLSPEACNAQTKSPSVQKSLQMEVTTLPLPHQHWNVLTFVSFPSIVPGVVLGSLPSFCHHRLVSHTEQAVNPTVSPLVLRDRVLSTNFHQRPDASVESQTWALCAIWWANAILQTFFSSSGSPQLSRKKLLFNIVHH